MSAPNETPTSAGPGTPDGGRHQASVRRRDGFRPDIQGLRAIAVGSVVLYHAGLTTVSGGYVGVDVFFVISGFLITGHLLRDILRTGRLSFGEFYARRARRILPAAFAVNILTLIAATVLMPSTELKSAVHDAIATALYVPNMIFANRATDYLAQSGQPSLFQHFWSLGVEEQFYLVWPLLLVGTFALVRHRRLWLGVAVGAVAVVSFLACVRLTATNQPWAFFTLPTRAWEFAAGGLTALIIASGLRLPRVPAALAVWAGLAGLGIAIFGFTDATRFPGTAAALPVLATALVILGGAGIRFGSAEGSPSAVPTPSRWLGVAAMAFVGEISYSLYLVHWPIFTIARYAGGEGQPLSLPYRLVLLVLCLPAAYLLYRFVENPVRRSGWIAALRPSRTLLGALSCSLVVVVGAVGAGVASAGAPMSTDKVAPVVAVGQNPVGTPYVPTNIEPPLSRVGKDNPDIYGDGCHLPIKATTVPTHCTFGSNMSAPLVVLFGDSHAAQWFPALQALATQGAIRLESDTKSGCPSAEINVDYISSAGPQSYRECTLWRAAVRARLAAAPPDLVILSNYNRPNLPHGGVPAPGAWARAVRVGIAKLPAKSAVLVLGETPLPPITPADCLAAHLTDTTVCAVDRGEALDAAMASAEMQAVKASNAQYVDLNSYICNPNTCPPIIGNVLVYRDNQHLTATFAETLAPVLGQAIRTALNRHG
jgi:peptidoglycan/LPS O-acetylase OafA/YrhL